MGTLSGLLFIHITIQEEQLRPRIGVKYFLSFPQKNLSPEKTETNQVFTFQFLSDKIYSHIYQKKPFGTLAIWQNWCFDQFYHLKN